MRDKTWSAVLWLLGLVHLGLGAWAGASPATFTGAVADFGTYNPHLIHDVAAAMLAIGGGLVAAAYLTSWRTPVLTVAALWNGFHAASHIVDVNDAATRLMGVGEAVLLVITALALAWLARRSARA